MATTTKPTQLDPLERQIAALERIAEALEAIQAQGKQNQHNLYRLANATVEKPA